MERLIFTYQGGRKLNAQHQPTLTGVLGSGNLEVLIEAQDQGGACSVEVLTAARGFGATWQAVLDDFFARHPLSDIRVSINDAGATPAVVSLRLDQAVETFLGGQA
jgi:malonate decarboxylase delta subunit